MNTPDTLKVDTRKETKLEDYKWVRARPISLQVPSNPEVELIEITFINSIDSEIKPLEITFEKKKEKDVVIHDLTPTKDEIIDLDIYNRCSITGGGKIAKDAFPLNVLVEVLM